MAQPKSNDRGKRSEAHLERLTARERQVLAAIATGDESDQIATTLGITIPTLKRHLANVYAKLGCANRVQLSNLHHFGDRRGPAG